MKLEAITYLIDGYLDQIFDYLIQLDLYKIDYADKYGEKASNRFEQSYYRSKVFTVKQILKQVFVDLPKISFFKIKKLILGPAVSIKNI